MDGFEKFTQVGSSFASKMTIRKDGYLGWSQGAANKFGIDGEGYYAIFFYHSGKRLVGIKITHDSSEEGAVKIQWRKQSKGAVIQCSIRSFLDFYGIDYSETVSYEPELDGPSELILIRLDNPKEMKSRAPKSNAVEPVQNEPPVQPEPSIPPEPLAPEPLNKSRPPWAQEDEPF